MININLEHIKTVFVLEDNENRIDFFMKTFKDCNLFVTKDVKVAKKALNDTKFDILFLDHDLEEINELKDERLSRRVDDGLMVAEMIRETINELTPCIIHSMNPTGSANMLKAHPFNTCHIPFHILKESFSTPEKEIK